MKKLCALSLSLALAASLTVPAFAAEDRPLLIAPNPDTQPLIMPISARTGYTAKLTLNGAELDASAIPACSAPNMLPLRLVAENDHGSASWFEEDNQGYFYLSDVRIIVNFADNTIEVDGETVEGAAEVVHGVTFIPAGVLSQIEGFTVTGEGDSLTITTPNNAPMVKLGYEIADAVGMYASRTPSDELESFVNLDAANYTEIAPFFPMMNTKSSSLFIAKVAEGKMDAAKAELTAFHDSLLRNFEHYLRDQYELAQNGKLVTNGDYILFVISEDNEKAIELFNTFVDAQK